MHLFTAGLVAFATGCAVQSATPASAPRVAVELTDAPGDFQSVWVEIDSVTIESADAGSVTLSATPQRFDLLVLQNDATAALGGATLAPGVYSQLRLIVASASVVIDGVESPLKIASGTETGIKVPLDQTVEADMTYTLTLDYDAGRSVKATGQGYVMAPVIRVKDFVGTPTTETSVDAQPPV